MINNFFTSIFFLLFSVTTPTATPTALDAKVKTVENEVVRAKDVYNNLNVNSLTLPEFNCFAKALNGFNKLKEQGKIKKDLLTVIDFSKSSNNKRLWIIDMATQTVLYNTYVAHGRNSGNEFATAFSNESSSNKSSLGFYATGEIYQGKHGESLRLDGLEAGINNNARDRAIVMHAADYVSENFITNYKRLGRSLGCPALPNHLNKEIINLITGKSCLFIYHPTKKYLQASKLLS
ncbi:murein L,D-transpeptidase catalytic domain family protein [Flavobacterium salilacus subsp. salilacus]|uniref:murein L,D-transpeptidase catalytic domain family protein n=1 Tax=Flavobacterium TaxID=237 RepID=UPI0010754B9A|nr:MULTISPECIES: murein L,D-transpeptidase catalytic domain family protein [Flavobacterium]KAF2518144.1 murein L,D-transpeptidase catalytic domain family protein [Flavobacterium salilacus subsp. salilacus]MBE1615546.1 murein L,D-transpeptidase catalytic domain family protein [Flavobacterium sp. SaA2.13]